MSTDPSQPQATEEKPAQEQPNPGAQAEQPAAPAAAPEPTPAPTAEQPPATPEAAAAQQQEAAQAAAAAAPTAEQPPGEQPGATAAQSSTGSEKPPIESSAASGESARKSPTGDVLTEPVRNPTNIRVWIVAASRDGQRKPFCKSIATLPTLAAGTVIDHAVPNASTGAKDAVKVEEVRRQGGAMGYTYHAICGDYGTGYATIEELEAALVANNWLKA